jgi:pimeloyl-ACP methyl ester carboxylesterase
VNIPWEQRGAGAKATLAVVLLTSLCACAGSSKSDSRQPPDPAAEPTALDEEPRSAEGRQASTPAPSSGPGPRSFGYLEVPGFLPAPFAAPSPPTGLGGAFRVFVITHGAGGRGEHHCAFWEPELPAGVLVVCPQGSLLDRRVPEGGAYFADHLALRREITAVIEAIRSRWGKDVQDKQWRYIGYSQGATMGALALVGELALFTELVLIEGGGESWSTQRARAFQVGGGQRVLLACGTPGCAKRGEQSASTLRQVGLEALHVYAPGSGHTYGGEVARRVHETMARWDRESGLKH